MARVKDTSSFGTGIPAAGKKQDKKATRKSDGGVKDSEKIAEPAKSSSKGKRKLNQSGTEPAESSLSAAAPMNQEDNGADSIEVGKKKVKKTTKKATEAQDSETTTAGKESSLSEMTSTASNVAKSLVDKGKSRIAAINERTEANTGKKIKRTTPSQSEEKPTKKAKTTSKLAEEEQPTKKSSKKRKATEEDGSGVEVSASNNVSSPAGTAKKQKKSVKSQASSAIEAVTSTVKNAAKELANGQTSIVEDVANLAKNAVESKPRTNKSAVKGKKDAKSAIEPTAAELEDGGVSLSADAQDEEANGDDEWQPEDEVAQLITGFQSGDEEEDSGDEGFKQGSLVPKLPKSKALTAEERQGNSDGPGVIYIGRIPHGFHEHEMRAYFSQFGGINHVRLSRSKKTGRSKHYAFLEFKSEEVAKIAAKTMDNYLLFGHILKCSFVPQEQIHPSLWKGADKRFKTVPWARIEGRKLTAPKGRTQWQKKIEQETQRRADKASKLKEIGYEYEPTKLTFVDSVPVQASKYIENDTVEEKTIVVAQESNSIVVSEEVKTKKAKKSKALPAPAEDAAPSAEASSGDGKRVKKPSKRALEAATDGSVLKKGKKVAAG